MTTLKIAAPSEDVAAPEEVDDRAGGRGHGAWRPPLLWRMLLLCARCVALLFCRLRVFGEIPGELQGRPVILAANHIGVFDPIALSAACARLGLAPRIMATGGLFRAPMVGSVMRSCGHVRVERGRASVTEALEAAVDAVREGAVVAGYPEGRITWEPGMWPERGRTGIARLALATGVPVIPVSQWGAHEVMTWSSPAERALRLWGSLWRRPVAQVSFGAPVDLSDLGVADPGAPQRATDRIMAALVAGLEPLRADEPTLPRYVDPTRPVSAARAFAARE